MGQPVTIVDEDNKLYNTDKALFVTLPLDLFTDGGDGESRRLRVDPAQTGFFAGREFRTFFEFTGSEVVKANVPLDVILFSLEVTLLDGEVSVETVVGGTEGGTFDTSLPVIGRNNMASRPTPFYEAQVTLDAGGTHTGGTVLDILLNKTANNANFASSVGSASGDERGIASGTYYFRINTTGQTSGVLKARWEERP